MCFTGSCPPHVLVLACPDTLPRALESASLPAQGVSQMPLVNTFAVFSQLSSSSSFSSSTTATGICISGGALCEIQKSESWIKGR